MNKDTLIGVLVGALLVLSCVLIFQTGTNEFKAQGATSGASGPLIAVASDDHLYLIDTQLKKIAYYRVDQTIFRLYGARSYEYDHQIDDLAKSRYERIGATYKDMKDIIEKAQKRAKKNK